MLDTTMAQPKAYNVYHFIPFVLPMIQSIRKNNSELSTGHQTVRLDAVDSDPASAVTGSSFCHVAVNASL